jgi:hypothetical protein
MRESATALTAALLLAAAPLVPVTPPTLGVHATHGAHGAGAPLMSAEETIKIALSAAPPDLADNAAVVAPAENGQMQTLRPGTNGWICMASPEVMCLDEEWQRWVDAWIHKKEFRARGIGVAYMLQGDRGTSNTDPYATQPSPANQWVRTGPHIMILTPDSTHLETLPTEPYAGGPWVMFKGTAYAHIMIPVEAMPTQAGAASTSPTHP